MENLIKVPAGTKIQFKHQNGTLTVVCNDEGKLFSCDENDIPGPIFVTSIKTDHTNSTSAAEWKLGETNTNQFNLPNTYYATVQINGVDWHIPLFLDAHLV